MESTQPPPQQQRSVSSSAAMSSRRPGTASSSTRPQTPASSWFSIGFSASPGEQDSDIETLYTHPNVKIVAFSGGGLNPVPGSLPWTSPAERTIAIGGLSIYRAPGSVAFVNCGSALQPILRKSQCWCVDEESTKFVLQIRRPSYWRIELPPAPDGMGSEDRRALSQPLRDVLSRILLFEKTECPFRRSFSVKLPEAQPVKLVPWVPRTPSQPLADDRSSPSPPPPPPPPPSRWARRRMTDGVLDSEERGGGSPRRLTEPFPTIELSTPTRHESGTAVEFQSRRRYWQERQSQAVEGGGLEAGGDGIKPRPRAPTLGSGPLRRTRTRPAALSMSSHFTTTTTTTAATTTTAMTATTLPGIRPAAVPPQLRTDNIPSPPGHRHGSSSPPEAIAEEETAISPRSIMRNSPDSFNTAHSWPIDPELQDALQVTKQRDAQDHLDTRHPSEASELARPASIAWDTVSDTSSGVSHESTTTAPDACPINVEGGAHIVVEAETEAEAAAEAAAEVETQQPPRPEHTHLRRRSSISLGPGAGAAALSPLPPAASLFSPLKPPGAGRRLMPARSMEALRRIPMAIISKAVEVVLGPPRYLLNLMLRVAAKITAGEWSGVVFGFDENGEQIPVRWDYSDSGSSNNGFGDEDENEDRWARGGGYRSMPGEYPPSPERRRSTAAVELAKRQPRGWEVD